MISQAPQQEVAAGSPSPIAKERLLALDVFRGFTLLGMVLVNSHPLDTHPGLGHAAWDHWGFADLIFPFFIFITGVAIPYSFAGRIARGEGGRKLLLHILRRAVLLFAIGLLLNGYPRFDFSTLRVMGILQRIAVCYLIAAVLYAYVRMSTKATFWLCGAILVLYFVLIRFVPVPGYGRVVLEPVGNWGNYIDRMFLTGRMQHGAWEGKSLLGTFPALVTMLMGVLTGVYLRTAAPLQERVLRLYFYGSVTMAAGAIWSCWFPINQNLWSSSLVLFMGGIALLLLASCFYLVDMRKSTWWTQPCLIFGVNSLAVWIFSELGIKTLEAIDIAGPSGAPVSLWIAGGQFFARYLGPMDGSLVVAILYDLFCLGVMAILYRRRIFIKL